VTTGTVIVDLDGTLLDTRQRHFQSYRDAVVRLGGRPCALPPFWAAKRRGEPWSHLLAQAFDPPPGPDLERRFVEDFARSIEAASLLKTDRLQPGVLGALARLDHSGVAAVLVTARRDMAALGRQLADLGLKARFADVIATGGAPKHSRIDGPLRAQAVGWIGDTEDDCTSARALGIPITLVTNGIRTRSRLAALQPDHLATGFGNAVRYHLGSSR